MTAQSIIFHKAASALSVLCGPEIVLAAATFGALANATPGIVLDATSEPYLPHLTAPAAHPAAEAVLYLSS